MNSDEIVERVADSFVGEQSPALMIRINPNLVRNRMAFDRSERPLANSD